MEKETIEVPKKAVEIQKEVVKRYAQREKEMRDAGHVFVAEVYRISGEEIQTTLEALGLWE